MQPTVRRQFRWTSGSSAGRYLGLLQSLGRPVGFLGQPVASSVAAVDTTSTTPTADTHRLCVVTILRRCPCSRWLERVRPDHCPQPAGGVGVFSFGNGQRSDIPHVLQRRYTSLPSPFITIFHYCW
jgi:hypothetical protein